MKAPLPPNYKKPLMATREFRWFMIAALIGFSALAVIIFEIMPKMRAADEVSAKMREGAPKAFKPLPAGDTPAPREQRYEGFLDRAKDSTPIEIQDESYFYLVRHLARADAAGIAKDSKMVDYKYFGQVPKELRGQTVRINALFLKSSALRLDQKQGDVEWIYRTYLSSGNGTEGFVVDLLERPPRLEERRDMVSMDAVFLKLGTYEGSKGPVQAPFFVGKTLRPIAGAVATSSISFGTMVIGVAVVSGLLMVLLTVKMWTRSPERGGQSQAVSVASQKA
jgi:hypothetical protein